MNKNLVCLLILLVFLNACDTVSREYKSVEEAKAEKIFEKGWLPDILPSSTRSIKTKNDLDVGTSSGEFYFDLKDYQSFINKLEKDNKDNCYKYNLDTRTWRFCCQSNLGYCSYQLSNFKNSYSLGN